MISGSWKTTGNPPPWRLGHGWEVWLDGMEITQFTYFQQVGSIDIKPVAVEITYGLERLAMYIQGVENVYDLQWVGNVTYGDVFHTNEVEQSRYSFDIADIDLLFDLFDKYEKEAKRVILTGNIRPAYDYVLKCSHTFNLLDARGAISVSERTNYISRWRHWPGCVRRPMWNNGKTGIPHAEERVMDMANLLYEIGTEEMPANTCPAS